MRVALGGTGSCLGQPQWGSCLIQPCAQLHPAALEPSAHPDTNLGMKKMTRQDDKKFFCVSRKDVEIITVLFQLREFC